MTEEELDERLRSFDRMRGVAVPDEVLEQLLAEARSRGRIGLRRKTAAIVGAALLGLGGLVAAPAAADAVREWLAVADWQPEAGGEILPDSEMVDLSAPDLPDYIASRYPEWLPLAPGQTREELIATVVEQWSNVPEAGFTQEVGLRHSFEIAAYCGWVGAWLDAENLDRAAEAGRVLADAAHWPAMEATDGDIIVEIMDEVARSAAAGDREGPLFVAALYGCAAADGESHSAWFEQRAEYFESMRSAP
jgi:hypothetical protein